MSTLRLYLLGAAGAILLALWLYVSAAIHDRDRARVEAVEARAQAKTATAQSDLTTAASGALEAAQSRSLTITVKAQELSHAVLVAPGADQRLPDEVLSRWNTGIDQLRAEAAAHADPASAGTGDVAASVPPSSEAR